MRTQTLSRRLCSSVHNHPARADILQPDAAVEDLARYAGTPRHVWQSLFLLISTIRPEWPLNEISNEVFRFRKAMPFPELSAAAIRAAQNPDLKTAAGLEQALLGAGADWLEGVNK